MEEVDRIPIVLNADAFCIHNAGGKLSEFVTDVRGGNQKSIRGMKALGDVDGVYKAGLYPPMMGAFFMSDIKVPGRDLPDDTLWQIHELGLMTEGDYDTILKGGWGNFYSDFCKTRLNDPFREIDYFTQHAPAIIQDYADAGIVALCSGTVVPPYEILSAGRGLPKFARDLHRTPEKVLDVIDVMMEETVAGLKEQLRTIHPYSVLIGAGRAAGGFLSNKDFEKFVWPYMKKLVELTVEGGAIAYLHLDMSWDRLVDYFLELPKGKCIFSPDGHSDIFMVAKVLKGHMCIAGDVKASMLTLGTPEQVTEYCHRLINEVGPQGLIMSSGCSVPPDAKRENVEAMVQAALEAIPTAA